MMSCDILLLYQVCSKNSYCIKDSRRNTIILHGLEVVLIRFKEPFRKFKCPGICTSFSVITHSTCKYHMKLKEMLNNYLFFNNKTRFFRMLHLVNHTKVYFLPDSFCCTP